MTPAPESRRAIFRTDAQWAHGVSYTLQRLDGGGVALFSRPAFSGWATRDSAATGVQSLAIDDCGRLFWINRQDGQLYRRDPINELVEPMIGLASDGDHGRCRFGRMLSAADRLWILDLEGSRLIAIRPDTFQILTEIPLTGAIDAAFGGDRLFSLDASGVRVYDASGRPLAGPFRDALIDPVALGADSQGRWFYVIDKGRAGFLRYSAADGRFDGEIGTFEKLGTTPHLFVTHPDGPLFVSSGSAVVHEFAADGGYIGTTGDVSPIQAIHSIAVTPDGDLYVGAPAGVARFSSKSGIAGNAGQFYTRTLDNGTDRDGGWQRVDLALDLDAGGAVDVFYASTDDPTLAAAVTSIFDRDLSTFEQTQALERVLGDRWKSPQALRPLSQATTTSASGDFARNMSHSVLFRGVTNRFLWIKLEISGLTPRARASVREMRVYYPQLSYLRYLPAVYQQDPVSSEFLGRFLSMFETIFTGLESTIERIPEAFDPELTPGDFLDWLAQWLDLGLEEDWPASVKRRLVSNAARLYQLKGTPAGLSEFIEVVTGTRPIIRESFETERPLILGNGMSLGVDSRIHRRPTTDVRQDQRTVLGCASILGTTEIRATTRIPTDPFRSSAHRFTVLLNLSRHVFRRYERGLHRIIQENAPAHVSYDIRLVSGVGLGPQTALGINLSVVNPQPVRLGYSMLGRAICGRSRWYGPEVGVSATNAFPYGER